MKTIRFTIFSILFGLLVLVSSCKKETTPAVATQTGSKILVTGQDAGTGLKSTLSGQSTLWVITTDQVGIYSAEARTTSGGATAIVNAPFTAAASTASSVFDGTMYWGAAAPAAHTFYAYYPYTAGSAASTAVPVSLASAQTQSAADNSNHIGALDFMVATPKTVDSPGIAQIGNTEVNLMYNHLFTILEFQITGSGTLNAVKLSSTSKTVAFSGGTINLNQTPSADPYTFATQTGPTTQAVVTLTTPASITGTVQKVYMVINPSTALETCYIGLLSGTTWTYITKDAPTGGFLRGKKYVVAVSTTSAGASPSGAPIDPAIDADGNSYGTVTIGNQTWMAENLKTTKYKDGTAIPNVTVDAAWAALTSGAYCYYKNNVGTDYGATYGALYNWYAVNTGNLCPTGWHVPTTAEWTTLTDYLGGLSVAGGKLKETGTTHWLTPNTGATNAFGFTALAGGMRYDNNGSFWDLYEYAGYWWSSTASSSSNAICRSIIRNVVYVDDFNIQIKCGFSVRCLRNP